MDRQVTSPTWGLSPSKLHVNKPSGPVHRYLFLSEKGDIFPPFSKRSASTRCSFEWFLPVHMKTQVDWKWFENGTTFERSMRIYWYPTKWCNHFQNTSNSSNHKSTAKWHLQTFPLWRVLLKWCAVTFRWPFSTDTCGGFLN